MWPVAIVLFPRKRKREKEEGRVSEMYLHRDLHCSISRLSYHIPCCIYVSTIFNIHLTRPRHPNKTY